MSKSEPRLSYGDDLFHHIYRGVEKVANAVAPTLGPSGRLALLDVRDLPRAFSKDGVTISRVLQLDDRFENMGARLAIEAGQKTLEEAGDGTTSTILLLHFLLRTLKPLRLLEGPRAVEAELRCAHATTSAVIAAHTQEARALLGEKGLVQLALDACGDEELANLVAQGFLRFGDHGVVTIESGRSRDTYLDVTAGMQIDGGWWTSSFSFDGQTAVGFEDCYIAIWTGEVLDVKALARIMIHAREQNGTLCLLCETIEPEAQELMVHNSMRGALGCAAVRLPSTGRTRHETLQDLAILTGAQVMGPDTHGALEHFDLDGLGLVRHCLVDDSKVAFSGGMGDPSEIERRVSLLKVWRDRETDPFRKERLQDRLAHLGGGISCIVVGGVTESEITERTYRAMDATHAVLEAWKHGVVPGGGLMWDRIGAALTLNDNRKAQSRIGKAFFELREQLLDNANMEREDSEYGAVGTVRDLRTGNLRAIYDPTTVVEAVSRIALHQAATAVLCGVGHVARGVQDPREVPRFYEEYEQQRRKHRGKFPRRPRPGGNNPRS